MSNCPLIQVKDLIVLHYGDMDLIKAHKELEEAFERIQKEVMPSFPSHSLCGNIGQTEVFVSKYFFKDIQKRAQPWLW